jgi:uncharacterized membrane protein
MDETNQNADMQTDSGDAATPPPPPAPAPHESHDTLMAVLSYIGPLVIVAYLTSKDDSFVRFHMKQGFVLFAIEVAVLILMSVFWMLTPLLALVNLATFILSIIGIVHAARHEEKPLPIIGSYSRYVTF